MSNKIAGTYTTKRDGEHLYSYEATWHATEQGFHWSAEVKSGGAVVGHVGGDTFDLARIGEGNLVRALVEKYIEVGRGIRGR